ncbi:MAG: DUF885 domain-containing protein [Bacteroidota bacterium]
MKYFSLYFVFMVSCIVTVGNAQTENSKLEELTKEFLAGYFKSSPITATQMGVHTYDSLMDDISPLAQEIEAKRLLSFKERFKAINPQNLSENHSIDYRMLQEQIDEELFELNELKEYYWDPLKYTADIGNAIASLIYQDFAPLDERMHNTASRLRRIPQYLDHARALLKNPAKLNVETAVSQNKGNISMINGDVLTISAGANPDLQAGVKSASGVAVAALTEFGNWLEKDVKPAAKRDTRIGKTMFTKKLGHALKSNLSADEIVKRAEKEMKRAHDEMYTLAAPLYKTYFNEDPTGKNKLTVIKKTLDKIVLDHPKKRDVMDSVKAIIPQLERFITDHDLLTLDSTQPLVIRETPEYERGISIASLESPGPLEKNMKSFYNVTPIPGEWTDQQVESYLREYNTWSLIDLSMHEGVPGHYVQLYYSNRNPSVVRSIFGNGSMIEGWAVYAERMMTDEGYNNNDPRMKLINLKWYIRVVINAILDNKIHAGKMTEKEAMNLMMKEGFQEEREAAGKWIRANLTSAQLSTYFVGFQEIWDLRDAYKKKLGDKYSLKEFNEAFLSYGSPPVKYIREMMLR